MEDPQDFIDQTIKAIKVLRCPSERAMELVAYRLKGRAKQWYQTFLIGKSLNLPALSWKEFSKAFMTRFLPANRRASLAMEFEKLTQVPSMIVSKYNDRFS